MENLSANWLFVRETAQRSYDIASRLVQSAGSVAHRELLNAGQATRTSASLLTQSSIVLFWGLIGILAIGTGSALVMTKSLVGPMQQVIGSLRVQTRSLTEASSQISGA